MIERARLHRRLDEVLSRRVALVLAGAGFGKTTLVSAWAASRRAAWYTLGPQDQGLERLTLGLLDALRAVVPDLPDELATARAAHGPDAGVEDEARALAFAGLLCERLDAEDLVLVLDDVQEVGSGAAATLIEGLCRQAGAGLHLVLLSRADAPFPVERLRGRGAVVDLRAGDLAFTRDETALLVETTLGGDPALADALHDGTAGWPAAVRMGLDALRHVPIPERGRILDGLLHTDGPVFDYLAREAFERETPAVQAVIQAGATLGILSAGLCRALDLPGDALAALAARGLFFNAEPQEPGWFEVRPLARDFVAARYPHPDAGTVRRRAAAWYEAHGRDELALDQRVALGDPGELAALLERRGDALLRAGRVAAVIGATRAVPAGARTPAIELIAGQALQIAGDWEGALTAFRAAAGAGAALDPGLAWRMALIHQHRGELDRADAIYRRAREDGAPEEVASLLAGRASLDWLRGETAACREHAERALELGTAAQDPASLSRCHTILAMLAAAEGDRTANSAHYGRALEHAEAAGDVLQTIRIRVNRGSLYYEEGDYALALDELDAALRLADVCGFAFYHALALNNLGGVRAELGRFEEALVDLEASRRLYDRLGSHDIGYPLATMADIHRKRGAPAQARALYEQAIGHADQQGDVQGLVPALAGLARVIARDDPDAAQRHVTRALECGTGLGYVGALIAAADVAATAGDRARALELARRAGDVARHRRDRAGQAEALELEAAQLPAAEAETRLAAAISVWKEIGSPVGEARAELALAALVDPVRAAPLAERAERILRGVGANAYAPAAAQLHARLRERDGVAITTLGHFGVVRDGRPVAAGEWQSKKARQLLRILVARRGRPTHRELLMETLWPGEDAAKLPNRLSVALSTARSVLAGAIVTDGDAIGLDPGRVRIDVEEFLRAAEAGLAGDRDQLAAAEALYGGDFLEEDLFEDWAAPVRDEARSMYMRVARALAEDAIARGRPDEAERYLRRTVEKDPYDENAHLTLVEALVLARRHGDARRAYGAYAARMGEIGVEPAPYAAAAIAI